MKARSVSAKNLLIDKILVIIFGLFMTFTLIASIYVKYGEYAFGALIFTALFWALIEIMTPASKHWINALWRFALAFVLGSAFGGVFTYYTQFGYYIIEPALNQNFIAIFALIGVVVFVLISTWNAVWSHNKAYIRR
ncbi:MAG: hypothetical protein QXV17_14025 [Candidatus Micrarchaeaceae archaeon]